MFPRSEIKRGQKKIVHERRGETLLVTLIYFALINAITLTESLVPAMHANNLNTWFLSFSVYPLALVIFILPVFTQGYRFYARKVSDTAETNVKDLFIGFNDFRRVVLLGLWKMLFVFLWSLLLIIPGYIAVYRYRFAYFILMDHPELSPREALKRSAELARGFKWEMFKFDISFLGWDILCVLTLGVLRLWIQPYRYASEAAAYHYISYVKHEAYQPY